MAIPFVLLSSSESCRTRRLDLPYNSMQRSPLLLFIVHYKKDARENTSVRLIIFLYENFNYLR